jgi:transcriptional regulator with XRE-family HTH domain
MGTSSNGFARVFGDSLRAFLDESGISYAEAARRLNVERATLATYWTDDKDGKRNKARAELLFRACTELGFEFEFNGYKIGVRSMGQPKRQGVPKQSEQLNLDFSRQFKLTEDEGKVSVKLSRRHPGRLEFVVSLEAAS